MPPFFSARARKQTCLLLGSYLLLSSAPIFGSAQDLLLLKRVRAYWKEGDFSLAKRQIRDYLEQSPAGEIKEELHLLLGDLYLQEGNPIAALAEYEQIEKDSLLSSIFYNKALCLYETKSLEKLASHLESPLSLSHLTLQERLSLTYLHALSLVEGQNKENLTRAQHLLETCIGTELAIPALELLSRVFLLQENKEKAAEQYLLLSEKDPLQSSKLWMKASFLLADIQPKKALSLLEKVLTSSTVQDKSIAAYNTLVLHYRLKNFKDVVLSYEAYKNYISQEHEVTILYLLGNSLYYLQDYKKAPNYLSLFIDSGKASPDQLQNAYLHLLSCAFHTKNLTLYEETASKAIPFLKADTNLSAVKYNHLELLRVHGQQENFIQAAQEFLQTYPDHSEQQQTKLYLIYALYEKELWQNTENAIASYLYDYPTSSANTRLQRLRLNCASKLFQTSSEEALSIHRLNLMQIQESLLKTQGILSVQERASILADLANHLFLEDRFTEALLTIDSLEDAYPKQEIPEHLQLVRALCFLKDEKSTYLFIEQAEKILQSDPENKKYAFLRIHLFNIYVQLSKQLNVVSHKECLEKASNLLYTLFSSQPERLELQNIQWLAEYYYQKNLHKEQDSMHQSIALFSYLLNTDPTSRELATHRLSSLFSLSGTLDKKIELLEKETQKEPLLPSQKSFLFELAKTYAMQGIHLKALAIYDVLAHSTPTSSLSLAAIIERSKIAFAFLNENERTEKNPNCIEILNNLKDLENQRFLTSDLLYLEAGLLYAEYKSSLLEYKDQVREKKSFLLEQMLETIENYDPLPSLEENIILDSYKIYIDSEIALGEGDPSSTEQAKQALEKLLQNPLTPKALQIRIQQKRLL